MKLLELARHSSVNARAAPGKLGAVGDLLRQRMLEGVLGERVLRFLVDETQLREIAQYVVEPLCRQPQDGAQHSFGEAPPDHRGSLEHPFLFFVQPIDARCDDRIYRVGHFEVLDGPHLYASIANALQHARL
ncbi:MAG: hypothetical protein JRG89_14550, partial [Deltaproteobacteria bacterium]|nr:hypothetical protein [Deltaproteobacteria bacterium]